MKYTLVTTSGIHTQIAEITDIDGYTVGVIEACFPADEERDKWSDKRIREWIENNNKRMQAICEFMNDNNL